MTSLPTHSSPYALISIYTRLPTHSSLYALVSPLRLYTNRKNIPFRYLSEIVHLSRHAVCHPQSLQYAARKLSCRLDTTNLLPYVVVSLVISISRSNWLDDKRSPSICYQDNQSNWFDGESPLLVCHQVFRKACPMTKV